MPFRGHGQECPLDMDSNENEGIFKSLLRFRADAGDADLLKHVSDMTPRTKYMSHRIQNEFIDTIRVIMQEKIAESIKEANFFSILADETSDVSTTEQLTFVVRYIKDDVIREDFLAFIQLTELNGLALADVILHLIAEFGLRVSKLRGQGYDGAACMSGRMQGVQAHIKKVAPLALYTHCSNHCLNLVICKACTSIPSIRNMLGAVSEICRFFSSSPQRTGTLRRHILEESPESTTTGLLGFCSTRWVERHDSLIRIHEHLESIYHTLCALSDKGDIHAETLKRSFWCSDFIIGLCCAKTITKTFQNLSRCLQSIELDLVTACEMVTDTLAVLKEKQDNAASCFASIFDESLSKFYSFH